MNVNVGQLVEVRVSKRTAEEYKPPARRPDQVVEGAGKRPSALVPGIVPRRTEGDVGAKKQQSVLDKLGDFLSCFSSK